MSDDVVVESNTAANPAAGAVSAGTLLRRAREAAGLHVAALAVSMKVPVKKLEALEADRFDLLPDAVFVRALASSVCRTLKIDAAPILQLLPQSSVPKLDTEERGINAPFHASTDFKVSSWPAFLTRPAVLWVIALLLGVLVVVVFPESRVAGTPANGSATAPAKDPAVDASKEPVPVAVPVVPPVTAPSPVAAPAISAPVPVASAPLNVAPPSASVAAVVAAPPVAVASAPKLLAAAPSPALPVSAPATSGILTLKAKGESWVEVTDAKGVTQIRKLLAAGEVAYASGNLPLAVVIGRVDMTQVEVRGQAFSLDAISKDNVARFEVK